MAAHSYGAARPSGVAPQPAFSIPQPRSKQRASCSPKRVTRRRTEAVLVINTVRTLLSYFARRLALSSATGILSFIASSRLVVGRHTSG